jgi:sarcosine oxidase subunit beta
VRWTSSPTVAPILRAAQERLRSWGVPVESLSTSDLSTRLPWLKTEGIQEASWDPHDSVVAPSTVAEIYVTRARALGVDCRLGERFESLRQSPAGWELIAGATALHASSLVVAAGAWSKRVLRSIGSPLPLAPYRTQAAYLRPPGPPPGSFPSFHDVDTDFYVRPEEAGRVLAGDGTRLVEIDPETAPAGGDEEFVTHIAQCIADRCPDWANSDLVRAWSGVCASTPDRRPLVGPVPRADRLYCICGFNGFGVMRAAGAAHRLVEVIASNGSSRSMEGIAPVRPDRFGPDPQPFQPRPGFTLEGGENPRF